MNHKIKNNKLLGVLTGLLLILIICVTVVFCKPFETVKDNICGYESCSPYDPHAINVHIVPHSHDDVGWLKTFDQYYSQDVQYIITSVVQALKDNPARKFIQVETAFLKKWWDHQNDDAKQDVIDLVNNGQLEIINGAWSMNDEAATHYQSIIDQFTLGLRFLEDNLGPCARPRTGWQIDPFGHSKEHASINAQMGFDGLFFARIDFRDRATRMKKKTQDLLWRASSSLGSSSDIFTSVLFNHYSAPMGFCFDVVCHDAIITHNNYEKRVKEFVGQVIERARTFPTNNIIITMGDDFRYKDATKPYVNLDKLIKGFEIYPQTYEGKAIKLYYSTPSCYAKAVNEFVKNNNYDLEVKTDDFFPYADGKDAYWTGYYTSRPASKRFERQSNNLLQVAKQLAVAGCESYDNSQINSLKEALGVMQHHDAITGTEKQFVTDNYHLLLSNAIDNTTKAVASILTTIIGNRNMNFELNSCLLVNMSYCPQTKSDLFTVLVYNPLSRMVSSPVEIPVDMENWIITDPEGNEVTYQFSSTPYDFSYAKDLELSQNIIVFTAQNISALGLKVYKVEKTEKKKEVPKNLNKEEHVTKSHSDLFLVKGTYSNNRGDKGNTVVGYEDTNIEIDASGNLQAISMHGVKMELFQDLLYYLSADSSGAYIFVPKSSIPIKIAEKSIKTTFISGEIFQGVVQEFSDWAKQTIKVYNDDRSYVEFDWVIGPIDSGRGKEIITRFSTPLVTEGTFYTDSNGREMIKRVKNHRATYNYSNEEPVAGNYYPVNTRIALRDQELNISFSIITDRSHGGSSLHEGEVELMLHRSCHHDDGRGVQETLNEQQYGQGIVVRGRYYVTLGFTSGDGERSIAALEKDIVQRKTLAPWTFIADRDLSGNLNELQWTNLNTALPEQIQILTLEPWSDDTILLRLEHVLEIDDDSYLSREVTIDLTGLFFTFTIDELLETTLDGNLPLNRLTKLDWGGAKQSEKESKYLSIDNRLLRDSSDLKITLVPMQIRTFLAKITYNN